MKASVNSNPEFIPSFEEGLLRRSNKSNATLSNRRSGGGHTPRCEKRMTSPVAPNSEGSVPFFDSARQPLLRGGDKTAIQVILPLIIILLVALPASAQSLQPAGWDSQIKPRDAVDLNPDPHIVEVNIEA